MSWRNNMRSVLSDKAWLLLVGILFVGLILRLYGQNWDQGGLFHPDERSIYMRAGCMFDVLTETPGYTGESCFLNNTEMEPGIPTPGVFLDADKSPLNPHWFPLGSILIYVMVAFRFGVERFTDIGALDMRYVGRPLSALADVGSVFMVYLLGKIVFSRRVGLLAAALVALAVIHIQISHFYRPEPLLVFFLMASFWYMLKVMERLRPRDSALLGLFVLAVLTLPSEVSAQTQQLPAGMTEAQVIQRLQQSGLTREEVRSRLTQLGYDPALADPYFDRLEEQTDQLLSPENDFVRALQAMGLLTGGEGGGALQQALPALVDTLLPAEPPALEEQPDAALRVFGRSVFSSRTSQFQPMLMGPVDPGYRLGPGDELFLVLTGDVELAYSVEVTREGYVVIPDVGQVSVNGLTIEGLRSQLYDRLGRVYSGVRRGANATTLFDVSLGRLRMNQVFVIGDVVRPGAYQVSSVATVFNGLHLAGGPSDLGSFRNVIVRRGAAVAGEVDIYDYVIAGDASRDVRLDHGDIVFVPPVGVQVAIDGRVRRRAIYEVAEGEGLRDALRFAGGLEADAHLQRVQIDRVLPAAERTPGVDRVLLDVNLAELVDPEGEVIRLRDGDDVRVFATLAERRNRVVLTGSVCPTIAEPQTPHFSLPLRA